MLHTMPSLEDQHRVTRLKTPEECRQFMLNAEAKQPDLVPVARRHAIELKIGQHAFETDVSRDIWRVVYAREEVIFFTNKKNLKARHIRKSIEHRGEIEAVAAIVRKPAGEGFELQHALGLGDYTFEAVVIRHPHHFDADLVKIAQEKQAMRMQSPK